jgi:hypothetical protein
VGTIIGLCLFPWAMRELFFNGTLWPTLIYTFFFYGFGFTSHYLCDGQVSETWRQFLQAYKFAVRLNLLTIKGQYASEEKRFRKSYPETLWIYLSETQVPPPKGGDKNKKLSGRGEGPIDAEFPV